MADDFREAFASEDIMHHEQLPTEDSCLGVCENSGDRQRVEWCWCCSFRQALEKRSCLDATWCQAGICECLQKILIFLLMALLDWSCIAINLHLLDNFSSLLKCYLMTPDLSRRWSTPWRIRRSCEDVRPLPSRASNAFQGGNMWMSLEWLYSY